MSGVKVERADSTDTCPVCHDQIEIFAIGPCDHPVCYRCSTRMRVLCEKMDCPICRSSMPQVAFVYEKSQFKDINLRKCIPNRKYKIFFEDEEAEDYYLELLEFRCRLCRNKAPDKSFAQLQTHMRREHELFACDLCVSHLRIFPFERKFYNRKSLAIHRRVGDEDDKSYKGHPLCEFCDTRYNDKDELHKHLRQDHFFCHFCDQHGSNAYYDQYSDLLAHFSGAHFLCTEGECGNSSTRFTHAFATEIDMKAHKASTHNKNLSRAQAREARTIELDFQLPPRRQANNRGAGFTSDDFEDTRTNQGGRARAGERYNRRRGYPDKEDEDLQRAIEASKEDASHAETRPGTVEKVPDPIHDFPTLGGETVTAPSHAARSVYSNGRAKQLEQEAVEDFPSLGSSAARKGKQHTPAPTKAYSSVTSSRSSIQPVTFVKKESKPVVLGSVAKMPKERMLPVSAPRNTEEEYPALGGSSSAPSTTTSVLTSASWGKKVQDSSSGNRKVIITPAHSNAISRPMTVTSLNRSITDEEEFPSLGGRKRTNHVFANPFSDRCRDSPTGTNRQNISKTKAEKCDDESFELPESYYRSYDEPLPDKLKKDSITNKGSEEDKAKDVGSSTDDQRELKPAEYNFTSKDFPDLPVTDMKTVSGNEKKKKKKSKKTGEKIVTQQESKAPDVNASLNDIALALIKPEKKEKAEAKHSKPKQTDWFDNPPLENVEGPSESSCDQNMFTKDCKQKSDTISKSEDDRSSFPSLHSMTISVQPPKPPPGFRSEPPTSLAPSSAETASSVSAPPGFKTHPAPSPAAPAPPPGFPSSAIYTQPPEFKARNLTLIEDIRKALETIEDGFANFKALSGHFRQGMMDARDYYQSCQALMGNDDFARVFPELLALLPDIVKQHELWAVHQASEKGPKIPADVLRISQVNSGRGSATWQKLSQCPRCGQVLLTQDVQHHQIQHDGISDFPALGDGAKSSVPSVPVNGTWIKAK